VIDDIPDPNHHFQSIWNVLQHGTLEVTETNLSTLQQFTQRLKCEELDRRLFEFELSGEDLNERNAVSRLLIKSNRLLSIDEEVAFIASRLDEIESLNRLPPSLLEIVLESVSLRIETEDWLLELICGLGSEYDFLIRYVRCEFLSPAGIDKFIETVDVERIDSVLWASICSRLKNTCTSSLDPERLKVQIFPHGSADLEGIIRHLTAKCGGNVHTKGSVAITASFANGSCAETIADFGQPSGWYSNATSGAWFMFEFNELSVSIDGYSLNSGTTGYYLRTWELEVSNDKSSWVKIDGRATNELNGSNVTRYFACNSASTEFYRFVRIRQTNTNHNGNWYLAIGNVEFFGRLQGRKPTE
jgi:hypothetical protein